MRVELERSGPWLLASVVAFSLTLSAAWADDSKAKTASGQLTAQLAGLKGAAKPIGKSNPPTLIEHVGVGQAGQETQVRVEGNGNLSYALSRLSQPDRLVLDFSGVLVHMQQKLIPSNLRPVHAVRVGQFKDDVARVVVELDGAVSYRISAAGNAVTVRFQSSAMADSRAAAAKEKPVDVHTVRATLPPRLPPGRKETDSQRMPLPEPPMPPEMLPGSLPITPVTSSEPVSTEARPAASQAPSPLAPPPVIERDLTAEATEQPGKDRGKPVGVPSDDDYTIGLQDVLAISVWREPELSRTARVRPDGKISLPLIGEVKASGLPARTLQAEIAKELEAYIQKPEVTVSIQEANSHRFSILGEVQRPGSYMLAKPMTVLDAIAMAGGFREFAKVKKIFVLRRVPTRANGMVVYEEVKIYVNYKEVINGEHPEQNVELEPGDTVVVP